MSQASPHSSHGPAAITAAHSIPSRPARSARPTKPSQPGFESLDEAHRAALRMLENFKVLLAQLDGGGLDDAAQQSAQGIMAFFNGPGRDHHAQEEQFVFPGLLASGDPVLAGHVRRLVQDHGWIEEDWRELSPQVEAIAAGYNWYDMGMLTAALPVFTALYQDHIALEETVVYPAARQQQDALNHRSSNPGG
jgi:hemerythrin-like domain-containing protein